MQFLEELFEYIDDFFEQKDKKFKKWEDFFPTFYSLGKNNIDLLKKENFIEEYKKILSFIKPFESLPEDRRKKRYQNLKNYTEKLKYSHLIKIPDNSSKNNVNLFTDIKYLKNVGEKRSLILNKLNIYNIYDSIYYFPREYEDRRKIKTIISTLNNEKALIIATIKKTDTLKINKGLTVTNIIAEDSTGIIKISFFNQLYLKELFSIGSIFSFYGKIEIEFGVKKMISPDFSKLERPEDAENSIIPVYGLSNGISQKIMRKIINTATENIYQINEFLPDFLLKKYNLLNISQRLFGMHRPYSQFHNKRAVYSLKAEECILFETALLLSKSKFSQIKSAPKLLKNIKSEALIKNLKFRLTNAQNKSIYEIRSDISSERQMNRLLMGDVGSGKTIVAEICALDVCEAGYQVAFMVPTSVLAKQQFEVLKKDLELSGIKTELLLGETTASEKKIIKEKLKNGEIDIIVGTHALIQDDVIFKNLGFIIIDEQHRFGVNQRLKLINKGENPDVLIMTATPIPRTLALTVYGDMEVSTIDEMPVGRKKVKTVLSSGKNPDDIYNFIDTELNNGNQVFFIYPLIEESELLDLKAATDMYEVIKKRFTGFGVGLLHGKMKSSEKNEIMEKFSSKDYRILVSTTVVEVGVNIPDATVMVIEHADRFGLSQLHQLRGRVGRSKKQAYCFLLTENNVSQETKSKLIDFTNTHNGFKVSEIDLEWRGPGKFFGTDQHGIPEFKLLDIIKDYKMIENIRNDIENIISENDFNEKYKDLIHEIKIRYRDNIDLINAL